MVLRQIDLVFSETFYDFGLFDFFLECTDEEGLTGIFFGCVPGIKVIAH